MPNDPKTSFIERQEILNGRCDFEAILDGFFEKKIMRNRVSFYCKEQLDSLFVLSEGILDELIADYGSELSRYGFRVLRGGERRAFIDSVRAIGEDALANKLEKKAQVQVFDARALFDIALILHHDPVAVVLRERLSEAHARRAAPRKKAIRKPDAAPVPQVIAATTGTPQDASVHRAISIRQPYVELILRGEKVEEYRSMPTNIRERVYLYASLREEEDEEAWEDTGLVRGTLPLGLIVGSVEIVYCRWVNEYGCYAYELRDPRRLDRFLKAKNQPQPKFWIPVFE